jgi:hypothetical protein
MLNLKVENEFQGSLKIKIENQGRDQEFHGRDAEFQGRYLEFQEIFENLTSS